MLALELENTVQLPRLPLAKTVIRTGIGYSITGFPKAHQVLNCGRQLANIGRVAGLTIDED
jgi:hypothetical protein